MSTWKHVGMTYLKYADLCATHVRNALKEPMKTKSKEMSSMHARVTKWEDGKRLAPGALPPPLRPLARAADNARRRAHAAAWCCLSRVACANRVDSAAGERTVSPPCANCRRVLRFPPAAFAERRLGRAVHGILAEQLLAVPFPRSRTAVCATNRAREEHEPLIVPVCNPLLPAEVVEKAVASG